jgi:hypothetical protein
MSLLVLVLVGIGVLWIGTLGWYLLSKRKAEREAETYLETMRKLKAVGRRK